MNKNNCVNLKKEAMPARLESLRHFFSFFYFLSKILFVSAVIIWGSLRAYNQFLVDRSIENLEGSLEAIGNFQSARELTSLRFFLDDLIVEELAKKDPSQKNLATLDFTKSIAFEAKDYRQLQDVKNILEGILEEKRRRRNPFIKLIDDLKNWLGPAFESPEEIFRKVRTEGLPEDQRKRVEEARFLDGQWKFEEAIERYLEVIGKNPSYRDLPSLELDLGYSYLKAGLLEEARRIFRKVREENPGRKEEKIARRLLEKAGSIEKGKIQRNRLIHEIGDLKEPEVLQRAYFELGLLNYRIFDLEAAEKAFRNVASIVPESLLAKKALFYLGFSLKFHGRWNQAISVFEEIAERYQDQELVIHSQYQIADTFQKAGEYEMAAVNFEKVANQFPYADVTALAQFRAGYTYFYNLSDPVRANRAFEKMKAEFTDDFFARYSAVEFSPFVKSTLRDRGFRLLRMNLLEDAEEAFREAIRIHPRDAWAHSGLGTALMLEQKSEEGMQELSRGLEIQRDEYTHAALAYGHEIREDYPNAIEQYGKALLRCSDYPSVAYNLGRLQEFQGDYPQALGSYHHVLATKDKIPEVVNNLGHSLWYQGKFFDAMEMFEKAVALEKEHLEAQYNLGLAYQGQGNLSAARRQFEKVLEIDPQFKEARIRITRLREREGT